MFGDEALAFGRAPRDPSQDATVLLECHLQVTILEPPRAINNLNATGPEDRTWIAGAERCETRQFGHDLLIDRTKRERVIDPEPRPQIVSTQASIGVCVDPS